MAKTEENAPEGEKDAADVVADNLGRDSLTASDAMMAPLKRLVETAETLEGVRDGIVDLYGEMEAAELGAAIARAMLIAEASGRYDVREEAP